MKEYPSKSPIQFREGVPVFGGIDGVENVLTVDIQGPPRDWLVEHGQPKECDALDAMARPRGFSSRFVQVIVCDESPTRFKGAWCHHPQYWKFRANGLLLTLAHFGVVVGVCENLRLGRTDEAEANGAFIIGEARLYDSELADAAWEGITQRIFAHVCPTVLFRLDTVTGEPIQGTEELLEVALVDVPGCPGARILKMWERYCEVRLSVDENLEK